LIEGHAQRLILGQGVVERPLHVDVVARRPQVECLRHRARGTDHVEVRRRVRRVALEHERKRALLARKCAADRDHTRLHVFGAFDRRERRVAGQRARTHAVLHLTAQRTDAGLRDDVDEKRAGVVVFGSEAVAGDVDRFDLRFRRERGALEAVDADNRGAARHLGELLAQHVRVVRERVDLLACERGPECRRAVDGDLLPVARHVHRVRQLLDRQRNGFFIVAGAHAHVRGDARIEAGELGFDRVTARPESHEHRDALRARRRRLDEHRLRRVVLTGNRHRGARQHAARLIHDGDEQPRVAWLSRGITDGQEHTNHRQGSKDPDPAHARH
jgi:hypothetical protein